MDKPGRKVRSPPTILDSVPKGATVSKANVNCRAGWIKPATSELLYTTRIRKTQRSTGPNSFVIPTRERSETGGICFGCRGIGGDGMFSNYIQSINGSGEHPSVFKSPARGSCSTLISPY